MDKLKPIIWTTTQKIVFRFFLFFFFLFVIFTPNGVLPFSYQISNHYIPSFNKLIIWLAVHLLQFNKPIIVKPTGSGDTTLDYFKMLFIAVFSLVGMLVWSALDFKRNSYPKLYYWLTVIVRYYAGITMITYGCMKIIKLQFPSASLYQLIIPYGDFPPMGLAWSFMGYSTGYNYFTGIAEFTCGILLFFRKTSRLGAVLLLVVASNIMAINYCFDVPVKLLSTMLVVMAIFLISKDAQQFVNFFLLNKTAVQSSLPPHRFSKRWKNLIVEGIKYALVIYVVGSDFSSALEMRSVRGDLAPKPFMYGIYNVEYFIRNHDTIPPLATDTTRWKKLIIQDKDYAMIQFSNDSLRNFNYNNDIIKRKLEFVQQNLAVGNSIISYTLSDSDRLILKGKWKRDSVLIVLRKYDENNFLLKKIGFRWIRDPK
ncbi:hypothetical protein [Mucilaginibacter arboris]|uniref:DoxX family protein n=1 Tax=Mucilaginibacter arboris TaxID=2682090 RepID=A0A7K1SXF6_9SPHI|nr:hypothetical protein [Mucilaginibacter arboris]MVN21917.1 hypothetical protein [Mucilaginibacter arboris]